MRTTDTRRTSGGRAVLAGVLVALVALAALTAPAAAGYDGENATIHVDDDWADKEDGNKTSAGYVIGTNATATIQAAIDNASNGDTVLVHDGTYTESIVIQQDITVKAADDGEATIRYAPDSSTGQPTVKIADDGDFGGPTLNGFIVERIAADDRGSGGGTPFAQGVRVSTPNATVTDNKVTGVGFDHASNAGIMVIDDESGDASGETVTNVRVIDNNVSGFEGALSAAAAYGGSVEDTLFDGNTLSGNDVRGLVLGEPNGTVSNVTLDNADYIGTADGANGEVRFKSQSAALDWGADTQGATLTSGAGDYLVGDGMSIQTAIDAASAGDTITVENGTYAGFMVKTDVTVTEADGADAVVDADEGVTNDGVVAFRDTGGDADNATIAGLTVDASGQSDYTTGISVSADNVTISGVTIQGDANVTGIQTQTGYDGSGTNGVLVTESTVTGANVGISLQSGNDTATDNTITGATLEGIGLAGTNYDVSGNDVSTASDAPGIRVYTTTANEVAASNALLAANSGVETVAWNANSHHYARDVSIDGTYYHSVQAAVDAASSGDTVHLSDGTYDLGSDRLDVTTDGITIEGESMSGVTLDGSDAPWPIYVHNQSDVTLRNFTLEGTEQGDSDDSIKAAFTDGLTIENVAVNGSAGNEIDLNNVVNATLRHVDANGNGTGGVGVALTAVQNATLDDVDTSGNTWGGVGLYDTADDVTAPDGWTLLQNTSDVTVTTESGLSEAVPLYSDQAYGGELGALYAPEYDYAVENPDHRTRGEDFVFYSQTKSDAVSLALGLANNSSSTVQTLTANANGEIDLGSTYVVGTQGGDSMSIQTAVDATDAGATVRVGLGTYNESVTIDTDDVTLLGAGVGESVIAPDSGTGLLVAGHTPASGESADDVTIDGFSVDAADGAFGVAAYSEIHSSDYDTTNLTVRNVAIDGTDALGVGLMSSKDATLDNVTVTGVSTADQGALELVGVKNLAVTDSTIADNALGIKMKAASGYGENGPVTVTDTTFSGNDVHVADTTGTLDAQTLVDANAFDVTSRVTPTANLTVYGSAQAGIDAASSGDTVLVTDTVTDGITIGTSNVTVAGVGDATVTSGIGFQKPAYPDNVTIAGFTFADTDTAINANNAGDDLTVVDNEFDGVTNALVQGGEDGGQSDVKTGWVLADNDVSDVETGFRLWNTGDVTVVDNHFQNLSGSAVSLIAVDGATVTDNEFVDTTKAGVYVDGAFMDAFDATTANVSIVGNTFDDAGDADTKYVQAAVLTGSNLADLDEVDVHRNAFRNMSTYAIYADAGASAAGTINARFNWFGEASGPDASEMGSDVTYDSFLTAPPGETSQALQQYGHDFTVPGDGVPHAVGFPADVDATYGELFADCNGVVYIFDAEDEAWQQVDAERQVDPMDAVVVVADERIEVTVDYEDAASDELTTPGEKNLEAGWNFVAAPQHGSAETAFAATAGGDVVRVISQYETAASAPYGWNGDGFGTYTFDQSGQASAATPTVSPYGGYWVYASDDGSLAGVTYPGMAYSEMIDALTTTGGSA
ncbi:beta strand repeat-containing protein [Halobacterium zhouii]|uniref:beta strand repeat-containing protein n=1 Tax=Halobacterium zhouii TaxID=2902624 RepID=UPI001E4B8E81|nr:right-handed parallel beta-helix repeat-containing protein [Halobacterium zhouii]